MINIHDIYLEHHIWLRSWLHKQLGCLHQAENLTHDTFIRLLLVQQKKSLSNLKEPRAYITTIAKRLSYDYFRRKSLEQSYLATLSQFSQVETISPQEQLLIQETLQELDAIFDQMKPIVRTAFLLSQLEGLTYTKIAFELNVSVRTVKRYMAKAFEQCIMHELYKI